MAGQLVSFAAVCRHKAPELRGLGRSPSAGVNDRRNLMFLEVNVKTVCACSEILQGEGRFTSTNS